MGAEDAGKAEVGNSARKHRKLVCLVPSMERAPLGVGGSWKEKILQIKKFATGRADLPLGKLKEAINRSLF